MPESPLRLRPPPRLGQKSETPQNVPNDGVHCSSASPAFKSRWKNGFIPKRPSSFINFLGVLMTLCFICLSPVSAAPEAAGTPFGVWENEYSMDQERLFVVQWTPQDDRILFRITARTRGYVGFGFHTKAKMDGADIVVGWVHSGKIYLQDRHGRGHKEPNVDRQQDYDLIGGFENDTHTVLTMSRLYVTCDPNDHPITNDTIRVLWAYHPDDPVDPENSHPRLHYHGSARRGVATLFLLQRAPPAPYSKGASAIRNKPKLHFHQETFDASTAHLHSWSLVGPPATIDASPDSIHWCRLFRRPHIVRKHHVVRYEPVLKGDGAREVHHMMVYECIRLSEEDEEQFDIFADTPGSNCNQANMDRLMVACNHVVVAWALGSEGVWLPAEAGYPLTPEGPVFYMLETHYNRSQKTKLKDAAGVRVLYTPFLRQFDAGVLSVGLHPNWKHIIPPRQKSVLSEGHCVGQCTRAAFPESGIRIFGVIFHTHLLGRKVRLRHLRRDTEFEPIASDDNYDFTYQEYRTLRTPRLVMPGDHLIGECVYDSRQCSSITLGGFNTKEEMCLSFVFYYPRVDLSYCHSKPSLATVLQSLGIEELSHNSTPITIRLPVELAGKTLRWRLQKYDWQNQFEHFEKATHSGTFNAMCSGRETSPTLSADYSSPNVSKAWLRPRGVCDSASKSCDHSSCNKGKRHYKKGTKIDVRPFPLTPEEGEDEEIMADDESTLKFIERIDVDPIASPGFNLFMPATELKGGMPKHPQEPAADDSDMAEEGDATAGGLEQMEEELETEFELGAGSSVDTTATAGSEKRTMSGFVCLTVILWLRQFTLV